MRCHYMLLCAYICMCTYVSVYSRRFVRMYVCKWKFFAQCRRCRALEQGSCMQEGQKSVPRPETAFTHGCRFPWTCQSHQGGLGGVDSEDELPPGIPSATGLPVYWLRAPLPPRGGGAAGPPPALRASASSLLAE